MSEPLIKYPRTAHIAGSKLQPGDDASANVPLSALNDALGDGATLVVEEKLDGANAALSFDQDGRLLLQSRGHYLTGGGRERHFALFKTWAQTHAERFWPRLGRRYVAFGEWLYAKHTIFYDRLPHYFHEFDVYDRETGAFLSTEARRALLEGAPLLPAPVLHSGAALSAAALQGLICAPLYQSDRWGAALEAAAAQGGVAPDRARREADPTGLAEGLYVKLERNGGVAARYKWVRASFLQAVETSQSHWLDRPILPNRLAEGVDLFSQNLGAPGAYDA